MYIIMDIAGEKVLQFVKRRRRKSTAFSGKKWALAHYELPSAVVFYITPLCRIHDNPSHKARHKELSPNRFNMRRSEPNSFLRMFYELRLSLLMSKKRCGTEQASLFTTPFAHCSRITAHSKTVRKRATVMGGGRGGSLLPLL
jgi:hypothetical protein